MQYRLPKQVLISESDCFANFGPIPPLAPAPWQAWQLCSKYLAPLVATPLSGPSAAGLLREAVLPFLTFTVERRHLIRCTGMIPRRQILAQADRLLPLDSSAPQCTIFSTVASHAIVRQPLLGDEISAVADGSSERDQSSARGAIAGTHPWLDPPLALP